MHRKNRRRSAKIAPKESRQKTRHRNTRGKTRNPNDSETHLSKQCIHFFLSLRWPPTSDMCMWILCASFQSAITIVARGAMGREQGEGDMGTRRQKRDALQTDAASTRKAACMPIPLPLLRVAARFEHPEMIDASERVPSVAMGRRHRGHATQRACHPHPRVSSHNDRAT
ncbi:hypothetical protein C8F04DRAFT_149170 [Mycena alexandri]|uniref:Uncharacterized protein n=1 Tax=Mycena alexandri TaxID=1745969 RepID=A0AAD6SCU1_9AGAR|nr:hypothetical protein C8F04DRAFT_149170 [Mycena alexandri]